MCIMPLHLFLHEDCCFLCLLPQFIQLVQLLNSFLLCFIHINFQICSHLKSMYLKLNRKHYLFSIHQLIWCKSCSVLPLDSISPEASLSFSSQFFLFIATVSVIIPSNVLFVDSTWPLACGW